MFSKMSSLHKEALGIMDSLKEHIQSFLGDDYYVNVDIIDVGEIGVFLNPKDKRKSSVFYCVSDNIELFRLFFTNGRKSLFSFKKEVTDDIQLAKILNIYNKDIIMSYLESLRSSSRCKPFNLEV